MFMKPLLTQNRKVSSKGAPSSLILGTSQTLTGTAIDFVGISPNAEIVLVSFAGIDTSSTLQPRIQLRGSGGFETTGYVGSTRNSSSNTWTTGIFLSSAHTTTLLLGGSVTLTLLTGTTWAVTGSVGSDNATQGASALGGSKPLTGALTEIRFTIDGAATFDAGTANIKTIIKT